MKKQTPIPANNIFANCVINTACERLVKRNNSYGFLNGEWFSNSTKRIRFTFIALQLYAVLTGLVVLWTVQQTSGQTTTTLDPLTKLLRLKLYVDERNYDDIVIGFNAAASMTYNPNEDSQYLPGPEAFEGLASYSSDGVWLSINLLPLPAQHREVIRLFVIAAHSGPIILKRLELDILPARYSIWLVDRYKKDSINLRTVSSYAFNINNADTASFGANRLYVSVSRNAAKTFRLKSLYIQPTRSHSLLHKIVSLRFRSNDMTKAEAIKRTISATRQDKAQTEIVVGALLEAIMEALSCGDAVFIPDFGTFHTKWRNETTGRLIHENTAVIVPAHWLPYFTPYQQFKQTLRTTLS